MRDLIVVLIYVCAALVPFIGIQQSNVNHKISKTDWPTRFQGASIYRLDLTDQERGFTRNFPGQIARFSDGYREIIMRHIQRPTRQLHPAADCLRGSGYSVEPQPISRDGDNGLWGCVLARYSNKTLRICERIHDQYGNSWYDVSSWYWSAILHNNNGPWTAVTVAEQVI